MSGRGIVSGAQNVRGGQPDKVLEQTPEISPPDGVYPRLEGESAHEAVPDTSDCNSHCLL